MMSPSLLSLSLSFPFIFFLSPLYLSLFSIFFHLSLSLSSSLPFSSLSHLSISHLSISHLSLHPTLSLSITLSPPPSCSLIVSPLLLCFCLIFLFSYFSAADLYIKDYLHPHVEDGHPEAKPLRLLYRHRWVQTVHATVFRYCLPDPTRQAGFLRPTKEDVEAHRVIVTTLSMSRDLCGLGLPQGKCRIINIMEKVHSQIFEFIAEFKIGMLGSLISSLPL